MAVCVKSAVGAYVVDCDDEFNLFREEERRLDRFTLMYRLYRIRHSLRDFYAVTVAMRDDPIGEYTPMYVLSTSVKEAFPLFKALVDGRVMPLHLGDVLEDKLGNFLGDRLTKYREFSLQIPENMIQ